jgi:nucleotide-binding universal stress UspA family protein
MSHGLDTIMLPVRGDGKGDNVFAHAAALAHRFGASVKVVHCHPKADDLMPFGVVIPQVLRRQIEEAAGRNVDVTKEQLMSEFRDLAQQLALPIEAAAPGKASASFTEYEGKQVDAVRSIGRLTDLICVAQPDHETRLGFNTLKSALFSSGRPVMLCPHNEVVPADLGAHLSIAWNGSLEATKALAATLSLIAKAEQVTILATDVQAATDLQSYLALKGTPSEMRIFAPKATTVGPQLMQESEAAGASVMIMGAYHDSYERETLFGGNSQSIVEETEKPVIMVH